MQGAAQIRAFYELAQRYCRWAEAEPTEAQAETVTALRLVAALYGLALQLPEADAETLDEDEGLTKLKTKQIYERFARLPLRYYTEVFNPLADPPEAPVTGDLADDLHDIYIDLKEGLVCYSTGRRGDAVFQWRTSFGLHWGRHALSALRALHWYETVGGEQEP